MNLYKEPYSMWDSWFYLPEVCCVVNTLERIGLKRRVAAAVDPENGPLIAMAPSTMRVLREFVMSHGVRISGSDDQPGDCPCPLCEEARAIFKAIDTRSVNRSY